MIERVGVLGAGAMGSRIAAHFTNIGLPVMLLDVSREFAASAVQKLQNSKPPAFYEISSAELITTGSFGEDMELVRGCDWVIEAVVENLDVKRAVLQQLGPHRKPDAIVSTNTSGLPVQQMAAGFESEFRQHWLGVHFFNPPRYMRLVELIPTPETSAAVVHTVREFLEEKLGKIVVLAKDRPSFIANRIGLFALLNNARLARELHLDVETVDALTGPLIGWPKTGTFALMDLIGLDVLQAISENFSALVKDERTDVSFPSWMATMVERGWIGDKAGRGFYAKGPQPAALDLETLEFRPVRSPSLPALERARQIKNFSDRIHFLLREPETRFLAHALPAIWTYAGHRIPEIADDIASIDTAMRAGFNWEYGPFQLWDASGIDMAGDLHVPPAAAALLSAGGRTWYSPGEFFDHRTKAYQPVPAAPTLASAASRTFAANAGAALLDIGDGIACLELRTKMNAIGEDVMAFIRQHFAASSPAVNEFCAFVIYNDSANFSAGANLGEILGLIESEDWSGVEAFITRFQQMTQAIKRCPRPMVAAPFGLCLGGGAELAMHAAARQAHAELSMGLVEIKVGLLPGGGGCKELALLASMGHAPWMDVFTTLTSGSRSGSASEARRMHLLRPDDRITMGRDRLLKDAKLRALDLQGTEPKPPAQVPAAASEIRDKLSQFVEQQASSNAFSAHDVTVALAIKSVICADWAAPGTMVSEEQFLAAERQAFVALCRESKTRQRIAHMLSTGKPLRN